MMVFPERGKIKMNKKSTTQKALKGKQSAENVFSVAFRDAVFVLATGLRDVTSKSQNPVTEQQSKYATTTPHLCERILLFVGCPR
jgi:hypothetical protein